MSCFIRTTQNRKVKAKFDSHSRAVMDYFSNGGKLLVYRGFSGIDVGERPAKENTKDIRPETSVKQSPYATGYISDLEDVDALNAKKKEGVLDYLGDNGIRLVNLFRLFLKADTTIPGLTDTDMEVLRSHFLEYNLPDWEDISGVGKETAERLEIFCTEHGLEGPEDVIAFIEGDGTLTEVRNVGEGVEENIKDYVEE